MSDLHLTKASIELHRPPVQERGVTAEYLLHQSIADLFGDREERGYVWRQLSAGPRHADVLLLSSSPPDAAAGDRMPLHRRVRTIVSRPFRPELRTGQQFDFELRVNATRVVTTPAVAADVMDVTDPKARKQRRDVWDIAFADKSNASVRMVDVYAEWLRTQLAEVAELGDVAVTERGLMRVRRSLARPAIPVITTNLVGSLTVREPELLVDRMAGGIGRSRAFGCGLLCLARFGSRPRRALASARDTA